MKYYSISYVLFLTLFFSMSAIAQSNPDAHTHGEVHVTMIYEKGQLLIELRTPVVNMLGFEHSPETEKQWKALKRLSHNLKKPENLIVLEPECSLKNSTVELPFLKDAKKHEHKEEHQSDSKTDAHAQESKSKEEHKGHEHEKHEHKGHEHKSEELVHHDAYSRYEWLCSAPGFPKITFNHFDHFSGFNKITSEWIVNGLQGITYLSEGKNILEVGPLKN